jgi:hypothetical protein
MLEIFNDDDKFELYFNQLEKFVNHKGNINNDTKIISLPTITEFINSCQEFFLFTPKLYHISKYKNLLLSLFTEWNKEMNHYYSLRFIFDKDTFYYSFQEDWSKNILNKSYKFNQHAIDVGFKYDYYFIDIYEEKKIHSLAKEIFSETVYNHHFCRPNKVPNLIDNLFHGVHVQFGPFAADLFHIADNYQTYNNISHLVSVNDLSSFNQNCVIHKPDFNFNFLNWESTKVSDLRITNIDELKYAVMQYKEYLLNIKKNHEHNGSIVARRALNNWSDTPSISSRIITLSFPVKSESTHTYQD